MKRKNLMTALMCTVCLTAASVSAPAMAEESTEAVTEAVQDSEEAQTDQEASETEEETEAKTAPVERPDYNALDYVTLGEYKGLTIVPEPTAATEDEINDQIRYDVQLADAMTETTEGTVAEGDIANIDYEGKLDGEAFDGGTSKDYDLEIGSHTFIDGFEEGLIGVKIGETVDLPLTFPEQYFNADMAGKEVVFTVTVNSVKSVPELTDELVNTITQGEYSDVAAYTESVRAAIEENKENSRQNQIYSEVLTQVANVCTINDYPQEMLDYGIANMKSFYQEQAEAYSMDYEDFLSTFLGMTEEEFNEQVDLAVRQNLQQEMYLKAIAEAEGIEVSDEEYQEGSEKYAEDYGYENAEELIAEYGESMVRISILQDKVLNFLVENAVIEEQTESETELSSEAAAEENTEAASGENTEESSGAAAEENTEAQTEA